MDRFDLVVVGAGPGGYVAAIRAAQLKMKVALVEKDPALGGTCLNVGCIPSKVLLESSENYFKAVHDFAHHGIGFASISFDCGRLMERKSKVVKDLTDGIAVLMKKNGVTVVKGTGTVEGPGKVKVSGPDGDATLETGRVLIAVGSRPIELPFLPFDHERIIDSTDALSFEKVPEKMIVIGAGAIGLELGSVYARLGSKVTFVELLPRIAPFAEAQSSQMLLRYLTQQGMAFVLDTKVTKGEVGGNGVNLTLVNQKGEEELIGADKVLVAVGRMPNTRGQGFEKAGIKLDEKGRIEVNEDFETSLKGVFAIGDCVKGPMLAHKASEEGVAAVEKMAGHSSHVNYDAIPNVVYTNPELSQVGMTEEEAKAKGLKTRSGKVYFKGNGRAKSLIEEDGFVKFVAEEGTNRLLGLHIVGPRASELVHEGAICLEFEGTTDDIAMTCHAHPTLSEAVKEAALNVDKRAIHG